MEFKDLKHSFKSIPSIQSKNWNLLKSYLKSRAINTH